MTQNPVSKTYRVFLCPDIVCRMAINLYFSVDSVPSMSSTSIICPNCGNEASKNYCAQCGQPTHLHEDTFRSLLAHFFQHYLHYESKLIQSIKLLWTRPGMLTVDYREKRRARHTDPLSMYLFIVVFYFIANTALTSIYTHYSVGTYAPQVTAQKKKETLLHAEALKKEGKSLSIAGRIFGATADEKIEKLIEDNEYEHKLDKVAPKIFFFMVPALAFILSVFLFQRKQYGFVDHAVFALHIHSFWFSFQLLVDVFSFIPQENLIQNLGNIMLTAYLCRALMRAYSLKWWKALLIAIPTFFIYLVVLSALLVLTIVVFF